MKNPDVRLFRKTLRQLERTFTANIKEDSLCCGVTLNQCHILLEAEERKKTSVKELQEYMGLDKSVLSRTVDTLVQKGFLGRKEDPQDRRYNTLHLSEAGQEKTETIHRNNDHYYEKVLEELPPEIRYRILEDLKALNAAFDAVQERVSRSCCDNKE